MRHANKTVTVYHKIWDPEKGMDVYKGTVLKGVSFFSKVATAVTTDGLTAASEAVLRIPEEVVPEDLTLENGDLVCEGELQTEGMRPGDLKPLCPYVYTVVGITRNLSVFGSHIKVVCK
jgi:hypothetical protein